MMNMKNNKILIYSAILSTILGSVGYVSADSTTYITNVSTDSISKINNSSCISKGPQFLLEGLDSGIATSLQKNSAYSNFAAQYNAAVDGLKSMRDTMLAIDQNIAANKATFDSHKEKPKFMEHYQRFFTKIEQICSALDNILKNLQTVIKNTIDNKSTTTLGISSVALERVVEVSNFMVEGDVDYFRDLANKLRKMLGQETENDETLNIVNNIANPLENEQVQLVSDESNFHAIASPLINASQTIKKDYDSNNEKKKIEELSKVVDELKAIQEKANKAEIIDKLMVEVIKSNSSLMSDAQINKILPELSRVLAQDTRSSIDATTARYNTLKSLSNQIKPLLTKITEREQEKLAAFKKGMSNTLIKPMIK